MYNVADNPVVIDNQSGYRVSLAFYTTHSETPNDSNPNGKTIDAMLIFIFLLSFIFDGLQFQPFPYIRRISQRCFKGQCICG